MKKKREFKPAGVKASVNLTFWFPGVMTCMEAKRIMERLIKLHPQKGDWIVELAGTTQNYTLIEEAKAEKMGLPKRPEGK